MGNANISTLPIAFSILASFFSANSLLGVPAEVYQYGFQFWITAFALAACPLLGAFFTGPFFAKIKVLSVFEYFECGLGQSGFGWLEWPAYLFRNSISCK